MIIIILPKLASIKYLSNMNFDYTIINLIGTYLSKLSKNHIVVDIGYTKFVLVIIGGRKWRYWTHSVI